MLTFVAAALAQETGAPPEARREDVRPQEARPAADEPGSGLRFLGIVALRTAASNISTTNPFLNGQLVGELGGTNTTTTTDEVGHASEQRVGAFFSYTPPLWDGRLQLDAAFEVDFAFGDQAYGIGGNTGGGFGADQVNLQTRRMGARARLGADTWIVAGLQFVGDGSADPTRSKPDDLFRSGGRLMFFGSEAAGLSAYGTIGAPIRYKLGAYTLVELGLATPDDVTLYMADAAWSPAYAQRVGVHAWYLRDKAAGLGSSFGTGPSSPLSELQGGPRLDLRPTGEGPAPVVNADLLWVGLDHGWNAGLDRGRVGFTALAVANLGRLYVEELRDRDVRGFLADVELRARIAEGEGSVARVELLASSGDDPATDTYEGILTGNAYAAVGAVHGTHGCLLLFPDVTAINRQVARVYDVSGAGAGVAAVTGGVAFDAIPNRFTLGVGGGHARSAAFEPLGSELNARISGKPWVLTDLGLKGAVLLDTDLPVTPWIVLASFDWLVI
ncbi:MAG: hypothetical protein Q8P18_29105 [Pseudomonadota bacterium]|nr:hypothetical protein [Pseudomonadota bacterium]